MKKKLPPTFREDLQNELKNPSFRGLFEKEKEKLCIAYEIVVLRQAAHLTQKQLARKLHVSQSAVARMESGQQNLTIETLMKIGNLLGKRLKVQFV